MDGDKLRNEVISYFYKNTIIERYILADRKLFMELYVNHVSYSSRCLGFEGSIS